MKLLASKRKPNGFTLIELLVVIGILAILLAIVLIAMNPAKQFGQAKDTKRSSDVNAILNAIGSYEADKQGVLPSGLVPAASPVDVGTICSSLVTNYISALPVDPTIGNPPGTAVSVCPTASPFATTGYVVSADSSNRVTVSTTVTNGSSQITATR